MRRKKEYTGDAGRWKMYKVKWKPLNIVRARETRHRRNHETPLISPIIIIIIVVNAIFTCRLPDSFDDFCPIELNDH